MVSQQHMLLQKQEGLAHWYEMRIQSLRHDVCAPFLTIRTGLLDPHDPAAFVVMLRMGSSSSFSIWAKASTIIAA